MKHLSLQWRITLMSVLLIGITSVSYTHLAAPDFAYAEDDSYTRDTPAEAPQAAAPMANEYKAESGGAMGEMSFDDTAEAEEASAGSPESQGGAADFTEKIIYSANVSIETTDFDVSVSGLEHKDVYKRQDHSCSPTRQFAARLCTSGTRWSDRSHSPGYQQA